MQYETTVENYNRMEEKRHKIETDIECFKREERPIKTYSLSDTPAGDGSVEC